MKEGLKNNLKSYAGGTSDLKTEGHIFPTVRLVWSWKLHRKWLGQNFHKGVRVHWHRRNIRPT